MEICILAKVKKINPLKTSADFEINGFSYVFASKKMRKAVDGLSGIIDCIDNDYTGDSPPYYARIYFGNYDSNSFSFNDDRIKYDGDVLFAKKTCNEELDDDTLMVGNEVDMYDLYNAIESSDLAYHWLSLHKILGTKFMESPLATIENGMWLTKNQILVMEKESDLYFLENKIYTD